MVIFYPRRSNSEGWGEIWTREMIRGWLLALKGVLGRWMTGSEDDRRLVIPGTDGITLRAIDAALREGGHGLPGGSSLVQFLEEEFGVKPLRRRRPQAIPSAPPAAPKRSAAARKTA